MDYNEIFRFQIKIIIIIALSIIFLGIIILKSKLQIIVYSDIDNTNISIKLNIKYLFNLININKEIYPPKPKKHHNDKNNKTTKKKKGAKKKHILIKDLRKIYRLIRKIEIYEVYSNINFGNENIQLTSFLYVLTNSTYGFLASFIDSQKMYLKVTPNFTKNYINAKTKIHIKPKISDLTKIGIEVFKILRKNKGGKKNEGSRINTKSNGNNA